MRDVQYATKNLELFPHLDSMHFPTDPREILGIVLVWLAAPVDVSLVAETPNEVY